MQNYLKHTLKANPDEQTDLNGSSVPDDHAGMPPETAESTNEASSDQHAAGSLPEPPDGVFRLRR